MRIYIASKTKHASRWQTARKEGANIISTWIDEAGPERIMNMEDLVTRCITEAVGCDILVLYCEPGEVLKGALLEAGAALGVGKKVYCVGTCYNLPKGFNSHPNWYTGNHIGEILRWLSSLNFNSKEVIWEPSL